MSLFNRALEHCEILLLESPLGQRMLAAYRRLPDHEQRLVWVASIFAVVSLLVLLLLAPASRYAVEGMRHYQRASTDYHWLLAHQDQAQQIAAARRAAAAHPDLQPTLLASAQANGLQFSRYEDIASGGLRLWLDDVAFADLMAWIDNLRMHYQLHVSGLEVDAAAGSAGRVRVRVDIAR
jgi:general secretion pathway protein M